MTQLPRYKKTRIAPTPSGYLHLGNAFSFALTASLAKRTGAKLLLRIDDLDQPRVRKEYIQDIFDTLRFLQIGWNEGPRHYQEYQAAYSQLHRMELYSRALQRLRDGGHVFACTCSRTKILQNSPDGFYPGTCFKKNIPLDTPGVCWRLRMALPAEVRVKNYNGSATTVLLPDSMQSFVVRKKDGQPSYQLTSVVDDLHYQVDLVVRGADLWPSTLAQLYLASLLDYQAFLSIAFYHHPVLNDAEGQKLSKSKGAQSILHLRKGGLQPWSVFETIAAKSNATEDQELFPFVQPWLNQPDCESV